MKLKRFNKQVIFTGVLVFLLALSSFFLSGPLAFAENPANIQLNLVVPSICAIGDTIDYVESTPIESTQWHYFHYDAMIGFYCNDAGGSAIYAVGFTNNTIGNTTITNGTFSIPTIDTVDFDDNYAPAPAAPGG